MTKEDKKIVRHRKINAKIENVSLGFFYDGKFFSAEIYLTDGEDSQGWTFGGRVFDTRPIDRTISIRKGSAFGIEFLMQVLYNLDVEKWEKLPGTSVRIDVNTPSVGERREVYGIGHYLDDNWFYPAELAKEFSGDEGKVK